MFVVVFFSILNQMIVGEWIAKKKKMKPQRVEEYYDRDVSPLKAVWYVIPESTIKHGHYIEYDKKGNIQCTKIYDFGKLVSSSHLNDFNSYAYLVGLIGLSVLTSIVILKICTNLKK